MSHDEASELLGAYALDAVDGDEHTELEAHLESCPRCRAELDSLREAAAALGNSVEPLPEGLWSRIASQLPEREADEEPPPMPSLAVAETATAGGEPSQPSSPFRAPSGGHRRRPRSVVTLVATAVAAAAVAAVLGIGLVRADNRASDLQAQVSHQPSTVSGALQAPGRRLVYLSSSSHQVLAEFVVVPDGRGYLVTSSLPSLGPAQTYQLWGITRGVAISLGLLGSSPHQSVFTMAGTKRPSRLSITAEPAGGAVVPTTAVVATGTV
jgi:anti-sigma factor RsiW